MPMFVQVLCVAALLVLIIAVVWLTVSQRYLKADIERLAGFMDHGPFAAYMKDADGRYVYENRMLVDLMRRVRPGTTTILGRTDRELFAPSEGKTYIEHDCLVIEHGKPMQFDEVSVDADGTVRKWSTIKFPRKDALGRTCVAGISIDVTDLRQAESSVQSLRHRFEQFLDAAPFCAYLKDSESRFLFMNRHLHETYPEVVAGQTVHDAFIGEQVEEFTRNDDWVRRTGEPIQCEEFAIGSDGVTRYWSTFKFPVNDDSGRRGVGGLSIEVTDRKRADEQVMRSESLLRKLIEVQEHEKRMLCHEIHDGLMQYAIACRMHLEAWRHAHPDADAAAIDEAIRSIDFGLSDGRRAIRGIRPTTLDDLGLAAAVEEYASSLMGLGAEINLSFDAEFDKVPSATQTAAFRIVQEACANAHRHSGTDRICVCLRLDGDTLEIHVEDFGRGFDADSPPQTGFGVTGMIERARLAGGSCRVESVPSRGTLVTARLPVS